MNKNEKHVLKEQNPITVCCVFPLHNKVDWMASLCSQCVKRRHLKMSVV